jgi:DNA-binding NarL/FixJ family response regulator
MDGRTRDAARWLAEADLHFERNDTFGTLTQVRALQVGVAAMLGDLAGVDAAEARLHEALGGRTPRSSQRPYMARAAGWAVRARNPPAAPAVFLDSAAALDEMPAYAAQLVYEALRAGAPARTAADRLAALHPRTDAPLVALYAAHATGAATGNGAALLRCSEELATLGARRYAVEAAIDAATAFLAAGRHDSARRAVARARELHAPDQGLDVPVVDGLEESEVALTRRERQLVDLAAQGLTNPEIADRLVLSVRTVESHLYRAMHKLGVRDRRDL